jgi:hypothetical protein
MVEDNIKSLNIGQTITANIVNIVFVILSVYCFFWGIKVVESFTSPELRIFGLLGFVIIFMRYLSFRFAIVYNSKDGGYIRFG